MGLNTSMYQLEPQVQIESPVNQLGKLLQVQNAQQEGQMNRLKMDEYQRGLTDDNQIRDLTRQSGGDMSKLRDLLYGAGNYKQGGEVDKTIAANKKAGLDQQKAELEGHLKKFELAGQIMNGVNDQASFDRARQQTAQVFGPEAAAKMPAVYDPQLIEENRVKAMSVKDQVEQRYKALTIGETQRHNKATEAGTLSGQQVTMRGQNMTDSRARDGQAQSASQHKENLGIKEREVGAGIKPPAGYRWKADGSQEAIPGGPADLKINAAGQQKNTDAKDVLGLLDEVDKVLPKATGSYAGVAVDTVAGAAGYGTKGASATADLKVLEGALISKMPKMSGPQSDKDVLLYRQMAGQIGDPTIPTKQRQAAADMVRKLNEKYAGMSEGASRPGGSFGDAAKEARFQAWKAKQ